MTDFYTCVFPVHITVSGKEDYSVSFEAWRCVFRLVFFYLSKDKKTVLTAVRQQKLIYK